MSDLRELIAGRIWHDDWVKNVGEEPPYPWDSEEYEDGMSTAVDAEYRDTADRIIDLVRAALLSDAAVEATAMSDERVERVISALEDEEERFWDELDGSLDNIPEVEYDSYMLQHEVKKARAVLAALDEEPLEDVIGSDQRFAVMYVGIVQQGDDDWVALVDDARSKKRFEGVGPTIDAAIRAAVAYAKEQG